MNLLSESESTGKVNAAIGYSPTGEPYLTIEEAAEKINVSPKTLRRWGNISDGPIEHHMVQINGVGRARRAYLMTEVNAFRLRHQKTFERAVRMKYYDKQEIIDTALNILETFRYETRSQLVDVVVDRIGAAPETVRTTIRRFESINPDNPISNHFGNNHSAQNTLYHEVANGTSMRAACNMYQIEQRSGSDMVSKAFGRKLSAIRSELARPGYIHDCKYETQDAENTFLRSAPEPEKFRLPKVPAGLPPYLKDLYQFRLLSREEEEYYLQRMNFRWYQISQICSEINENQPQLAQIRLMETVHSDAKRIENFVWEHNLRLVVSIVKRLKIPVSEWEESISEGNMSLRQAIRKFDPFRGNKLSTYASWAIMRNLNNNRQREEIKRGRIPTSDLGGTLDEAVVGPTNHTEQEQLTQNARQTAVIDQLLSRLDEREQRILRMRFGIGEGQEPRTLKEVGAELKVTRERIRQIEDKAIRKMGTIAREMVIKPDDLLASLANDRSRECAVVMRVNDQRKIPNDTE